MTVLGGVKRLPRRSIEFLLYLSGPAAAIVTTPFLSRGLGPEARGELGVVLTVIAIATMVGNLGQSEVALADARTHGPSRSALRIIRVSGLISASLAAMILIGSGVDVAMTLIGCAAIPFLVVTGLWYSLAIGDRDTTRPALANGVAAAIRLASIPLLAVMAALTLANTIAILEFAVVLGATVALLPYARRTARMPARAGERSIRSSIRAGLPVVAFLLIATVSLRADLFAVALMGDAQELGTYAAVVALGQAGLAVSAHFRARVQAAAQAQDASDPVRHVLREWAPLLLLCGAAIIGAALLADPIADVFFGPEYVGAATLLRFVAISASAQLMLDVVHGLLTVLGLRRQMVVTAAIGAVVTLGMLALLVPAHGPVGAAVSTAIASVTASLVGGWICLRDLRSKTPAERVTG